jgi:hypothetical protein
MSASSLSKHLCAAGSFLDGRAFAANGQESPDRDCAGSRFANRKIGVSEGAATGTSSLRRSISLADIAFIVATVMFFVVAIFYLRGCERLK